jgi:hypothetical protein
MEDPMQTSRFQLGLIAALATSLGLALSPSQATGYPAGAAVSLGTNPVWSAGGSTTSDSAGVTVISAPADHDLVVTDVVMTPTSPDTTCEMLLNSELSLSGTGENLSQYNLSLDIYGSSSSANTTIFGVNAHYMSGLRIPAGESLLLRVTTFAEGHSCGGKYVMYSISGYTAQP